MLEVILLQCLQSFLGCKGCYACIKCVGLYVGEDRTFCFCLKREDSCLVGSVDVPDWEAGLSTWEGTNSSGGVCWSIQDPSESRWVGLVRHPRAVSKALCHSTAWWLMMPIELLYASCKRCHWPTLSRETSFQVRSICVLWLAGHPLLIKTFKRWLIHLPIWMLN